MSSDRKNILFLVSRMGIGGIQTFVINLANYLEENHSNLKVAIYCHFPEHSTTRYNLTINKNITIHTLVKSPLIIKILNHLTTSLKKTIPGFNLKELLSRRYFMNLLIKNKIDLIHSNIYITDRLAVQARKCLGIPFITTCHGSYDEKVVSAEKLDLMRSMVEHCSCYVYMADKNLDNFRRNGLVDLKHRFIPYGFGSTHKRKSSQKIIAPVKFCMIARGAEDKGWKELHKAVAMLLQNNLSFELHVAADGELVSKLFDKRQKEGIFYYGSVTDPNPIISKCDIGMLPTHHISETMPFTIIEYLYHGNPVITTDLGSIKYMISNGKQLGGILVACDIDGRVSVPSLMAGMEGYIKDKEKIEVHSDIAYKAFEKFDIKKCSNSYLSLYNEMNLPK
ncbi:MAG: glycosyltransferase family 4 protein [Bacteroidota bacterium]